MPGRPGSIRFPTRIMKPAAWCSRNCSSPYLHDDRLLTLDDTVEFFNMVLGLKLATPEKNDLVAFLRAL